MKYMESLNQSLHKLMAEDERVYILGEDILDPYGGAFKISRGLSTKYPDRVISTPISEYSITGFTVGMALRGLLPVLEIMFGDFITICADQIINSACKFPWIYNDQVKVPIVIRTPMGGRRGYGATHSQTLESLFLGVPGLKIMAPSEYHNPGDLLFKTVSLEREPSLFIENKSLYPQSLREPDDKGRVGGFFLQTLNEHHPHFPTVVLSMIPRETPEVTLIGYGGMASIAAEAAFKAFMEEEILVEVLIPSLIKPFPLKDVISSVQKSGRVIIVEEGVRTSGWGAELASQISEKAFGYLKKPVIRLGSKEFPIPSSMPLEAQILPQIYEIEEAIYKQYKDW